MAERVKARTNGRLIIQYLGGPEVIPAPQQAEAVRRGVIHFAITPIEYYEALVQLGNSLTLSELLPDEERAAGVYDFLNEKHKPNGLYFLERGTANLKPYNFNIITNKWVEKPQELANQKIGINTTLFIPAFQKIGIAPTTVQVPDMYPALERRVVDGVCDPLTNFVTAQMFQVCKYIVEPAMLRPASSMLVNLESWNQLPPDLQATVTAVAKEVINEYMKEFDAEVVKARQTLIDKGMKPTNFSAEDQAWFLKTIYDASWDDINKRYPDTVAKLRPLISKK